VCDGVLVQYNVQVKNETWSNEQIDLWIKNNFFIMLTFEITSNEKENKENKKNV